MPTSVIFAVVAGGFGGLSIAGGVLAFSGFSWTAFGSSLIMSGLSRVTAKKPQQPALSGGTQVSVRQPIPPRQVIFGEARVGGAVTKMHVDNANLWVVVTLAGHPVAAIPEIYFADDLIPGDADDTSPELVDATGTYAGLTNFIKALGSETDQPFPTLIEYSAGTWTENHKQSGCAAVMWHLTANPGVWTNGVPNFTAHVRGAKVYDPRTATTGWTSNPALIAAHYLCNTDYGFGADYATEIDETDLSAAADACDARVSLNGFATNFTADAATNILALENVSRNPLTRTGVRVSTDGVLPAGLSAATTYYVIYRGRGRIQLATSDANARAGTAINITDAGSGVHSLTYYDEPRYTCNGAFTVDVRPREVLAQVAASMAGRIVQVGGIWHVHAGVYEAPTITLDESDLAGPISVVTALSGRETANGVKGTFVNPAMYWQPDDFPPVDSDTYLAEDGGYRVWKDLDLTAFVASRSQCQRIAKIELLSLRQGLTVEADFKLTAWNAMTGRTVALDNTRFGWSAKPFEVLGSRFTVSAEGTLGVRLTLRETAAAIYDWATDEESTEDIAPNTALDFSIINAPGAPSVTAELYEVRAGAGLAVRATASFAQSDYAFGASYQLEYKLSSDSAWTVLPLVKAASGATGDLSVVVPSLAEGTYDWRVRAIGIDGRLSDYARTNNIALNPSAAAPADLTNLSLSVSGNNALLSWDAVTDLDVRVGGYIRFRWSPEVSGATWASAVNIGPRISGISTECTLPLRTGTYLAKAVDAGGRRSVNAVSVITTEPNLTEMNVVETVTEHPAWAGTKSNVVYDATLGGLILDGTTLIDDMLTDIDDWGYIDSLGGVTGTGQYDFAAALDLGKKYTSRLRARVKATSYDVGDFIDARSDLIDDWDSIDGDVVDDSSVRLFVRTTNDAPGSPTPAWSSWRRLLAADYTARAFEFKAEFDTEDSNHNVVLTEAIVYCDMPDRVESDEDIASGAGSYPVTFVKEFRATPAIGITAQNMATGDYFVISSKTTTGFTIVFRNSAAAAVDRTFDWTAKGYGAVST